MARYSIAADDPGRHNYDLATASNKTMEVFANGKLREYVITADEEEGIIVSYALDGRGQPRISEEGGMLVEASFCRKVEVRFVDNAT